MNLSEIKTREEAIDLLEGYSFERQDEHVQQKTRRPLVKTYMLETVPQGRKSISPEKVFARQGYRLDQVDESLSKIYDRDKCVGLFEQLMPRHPVVYSLEKSEDMDRWINGLVASSPDFDNLWISGRTFRGLLDFVIENNPSYRFGKVVFQHNNIFEDIDIGEPNNDSVQENEVSPDDPQKEEQEFRIDPDEFIPERKSTRSVITDKLGELNRILPAMQATYAPMLSMSQIRFPSRGKGGHDFNFNGKAVNRSKSFSEHRLIVKFVLEMYKRTTELTETTAWDRTEKQQDKSTGSCFKATPVLFKFTPVLEQSTFENFIRATFINKRTNKFHLWGKPLSMGKDKVHVYALDRHLWQPLYLDITPESMMILVPKGTCGNTIHRLVTNVQQYLNPGVEAWISDKSYSDLIKKNCVLESPYERK